jgi:glycosyltransferase involved in cell wall biosynthesis
MRFLRDKQLYVVGEGKQKKILEASAPSNVKFLGNVSDETLRDLYARCLAVLYPSYEEEFGFVPIEGMASGKPVIACIDGGGVRETIVDGETGFLVEPKSEEIAAAVRKLEDRSLLLKMSENAMQRCLMFSEEKFIEGIKQNFELLG